MGLLRTAEMETVLFYYEASVDHPLISSCRSTGTDTHTQKYTIKQTFHYTCKQPVIHLPPVSIPIGLLLQLLLNLPVYLAPLITVNVKYAEIKAQLQMTKEAIITQLLDDL